MGNNLPKNWVETDINSVFSLVYGKGLSTNELTEDGFDVYGANGIIGKYRAYLYEKPKVIISCRGAGSGNIHLAKAKSFITSNSIIFDEIDSDVVNTTFTKYLMTHVDKSEVITGTAQPQITIQLLKDLKFPLPPFAEQQRIVAKLDALYGQLETIKKSLDNVPVLLKNFRHQILTQAVTGKLTEEWREGKELESIEIARSNLARDFDYFVPTEWKVYAFSDVADIKSNLVNPDQFLDYPLIAPDNIEALSGKLISKPLTSDIRPISGKHFFKGGSIIYSKIRPYLSKVILAEFDGLCSADMYPVQAKFNTKYLLFYMLSELFLSYANTAGERSVLPKINQKGLNIIPVPMPPLEEQQEIVRRIDSLFAKADAIEMQYTTLKEKIDKLPQAILHKAFKGELTQQLDTDGDARDLLKAIEQLKNTKTKKSKVYAATTSLKMVAEPK